MVDKNLIGNGSIMDSLLLDAYSYNSHFFGSTSQNHKTNYTYFHLQLNLIEVCMMYL